MRIALLVPSRSTRLVDPAYQQRLVGALRTAGHAIQFREIAFQHPSARMQAPQAAGAILASLPRDTTIVVDGLALPAFEGVPEELSARHTVALVQHCAALETGLGERQRADLRAAEQRLLPRLHRVVVSNASIRDRLVTEFALNPERIRVVDPGTDDLRRSIGSRGPGCSILSTGALMPRKGHDILLRALAPLWDIEWRLTIVGAHDRDCVHTQRLFALSEELGIAERVCFTGELPDAEMEAVWVKADVFARANSSGGHGIAIAEALRRGLPVALTSNSPAASLVPSDAGVICEPGDHAALSQGLRRLIFSADLRAYMGEQAWQAGRLLPDWEIQAARFIEALRS
ncbi:MAG: glycosyltransferase family 4 protein [Acetobacteraceae bacterium]|nr:glycosyltransferase family 4 protein [Acetobacteraceae bacterium]MBV8590080.1 glycosyltransferase family 4 protein [Acetobacteraceae bacterium]